MEIHTEDLESLIRRYVVLGKPSAKGFHGVKCQVCHDYKERGGFKFDGESCGYACFNCSVKGRYEPDSGYKMSDKMREILNAFGIPNDEIDRVVGARFFKKDSAAKKQDENPGMSFPSKDVALPKDSYKITTDASPWCAVARFYLESRGIAPDSMPFYVSEDKNYLGRVIIPYFFKGKTIFWQGRSMDPSIEPRYKNPSVETRDNVFFNMDEIYRYTDDPLFVTEGPLDALSIGSNCVALLGSMLSEFKTRELKKAASRRKIVFVIDKNLPGYKLGTLVLNSDTPNFYVACMPDNIDDANDALTKLGKIFLASHLASTASNGVSGKMILELNCSKNKR